MKVLGFFVVLFAAYVALVFFGNRWHRPQSGVLEIASAKTGTNAGEEFTVTTWNIGYAALGAKADFLIDGGENLRVLNFDEITNASSQIGVELSNLASDVMLIQENAGSSFLTRGVSVRRQLDAQLSEYGTCYWSDFSTVFVPPPLKINHGMSVYSKIETSECAVVELPQDPSYYYGFLKKFYGGLVSRYPITGSDNEWVVINIHLSAFDESAEIRKRQITALFEFAEREFSAGHHVVIGGDWNMKISDSDFPHTTKTEHLFWIYDFPMDLLPDGWRFAVDHDTPTVRTLQKPYIAGENYTMIIDGFAVSPNVEIVDVKARNLGFENTDHHPVTGTFRTK